jgi:hypothetical protein
LPTHSSHSVGPLCNSLGKHSLLTIFRIKELLKI